MVDGFFKTRIMVDGGRTYVRTFVHFRKNIFFLYFKYRYSLVELTLILIKVFKIKQIILISNHLTF